MDEKAWEAMVHHPRCHECTHWRSGGGDNWCDNDYGLKGCVDPEDYCCYFSQFRKNVENDGIEGGE